MDGNILNEDLTNGDDLDLASEELDFISNCDIGENENLISSTGLSEKSPISNQNPDTSSQELINRIETANDGDTILIEPGTYKLHGINITKNISLQGNGNPREVIIDGEELSTIFFIQDIGVTAKFNNLTFINGKTGFRCLSRTALSPSLVITQYPPEVMVIV